MSAGSPGPPSPLESLRFHISNCAAMAPLLDAFDRGTRPQKMRLFVVTCQADHILAEVFPTAEGPHAVWRTGGLWGEVVEDHIFRTRTELVFAAAIHDVPDLTVTCRCGTQGPIGSGDWVPWLKSGRRRVAYNA